MAGRRADKIGGDLKTFAELPLDADAELPDFGAGAVAIRGAYHDARDVDVRRIEEIGREAVLQAEDWHGAATGGLHVDVGEARRVQRELILRAHAIELVV